MNNIYNESKRYIEARSLSFVIEFLSAMRKILLIHFWVYVASAIALGGLFALVVNSIIQFQSTATLYFDPITLTGTVMLLAGGAVSLWGLREKRWLKSFGLDFYIEQALQTQRQQASSLNLDQESIDRYIELKVKEALNNEVSPHKVA